MDRPARREFMGRGVRAMAGFGAAALAAAAPRRVRADAAADRINVGVIGLGGRGRDHARLLAQRPDVRVTWLCDADAARIGRFPDQIRRLQDHAPQSTQDMRRIFEDAEVDAVLIAACDHWHGPATVWACQAGKDVYVEKPCSHNLWEGRKMIEAARKYGRVVQVGTQNRSAQYLAKAREYIAGGGLGEVRYVKVFNMKAGAPFRLGPDAAPPQGLDYDLYLGPAPARPYNPGHCHDGWKCFWAYSGGDFADDGFHQIDIARWLMGDPAYPKACNASGGNVAFQDDREVPDTQSVVYEFDGFLMTFELTQWAPYMYKPGGEMRDGGVYPAWPQDATRIELYGTKEMMYVERHGAGWQAYTSGMQLTAQEHGYQNTHEHHANWIDCIRSRARPSADIEIGHHSAVLVHLGNLGTMLGGRRLSIDPATEEIPGDPEANASLLRRREYRAPFGIPERV